MHNCCTSHNSMASISIPMPDFVQQNALVDAVCPISFGSFPPISSGNSSNNALTVDAQLSTYGFENWTQTPVSPSLLQADSQSNYDNSEVSKLEVPSGCGVPPIHGQDKGGAPDHEYCLQHRVAPASPRYSNFSNRNIGIPMEATKINLCMGFAKRNRKDEAGSGREIGKPDVIHVRVRRGQATNSRSLAERARRKRINERMRLLSDLIPGCYKATGKVLEQLDDIINYILSLQNQVEMLSMRLYAASRQQGWNAFVEKEAVNSSPPEVIKAEHNLTDLNFQEQSLPLEDCGKSSAMPKETASINHCIARPESLDNTDDSVVLGTAFADDVLFGFGFMDPNECNVDLQGGLQDRLGLP